VAKLRQGHIVWVEIHDQAKRNKKRRPAVVLTATGDLSPSRPLVVVAATTRFERPLREEQIELPWSRTRHPVTGLYRPCVVVCDWLVPIYQSQIINIGGVVPNHILEQIVVLATRHLSK
jgi:mRNA-degrading endonuclease toxin of MazEF toxin-antitoxin module